ncbi:hypothetical protein BDV25DRAFT_150267 [Aspergillus avenaceus]|uniref:Uncharacterized protein n=1 Tax=Aspergillus avenaceus TaxID=36643 RepID=A0A5N6U329_ASPAV|nr:hypothetical protein BDV25DRAFT_150267 [Aspergillus avenaceus]
MCGVPCSPFLSSFLCLRNWGGEGEWVSFDSDYSGWGGASSSFLGEFVLLNWEGFALADL